MYALSPSRLHVARRAHVAMVALLVVCSTSLSAQTGASDLDGRGSDLVGSWEAQAYALATGERHEVRGRIVFTSEEWQVLFFVMDGDEPARGSGEGGRYTLEGDELTFEHLFHLSAGDALPGLEASPLTMTARSGDGPLEPAGVELDGDRLRLSFPSGNAMSFVRSSRP